MPVPKVIDLSHYNVVSPDLKAAAKSGIVACIHKLTEGSSYIDDKAQARYFFAKEAGMKFGLYHFLRPGSMEQQAKFFVDTARSLQVTDDDTLYCADHEDQSVRGEELKVFLDALEDLTNRSPVVYSGHVLKEQLEGSGYRMKRRLWLCQYCSPPPVLPEGVDAYWLWQYTDGGSCPGVEGACDLNTFDGDTQEFLRGWAGRYDAPMPAQQVVSINVQAPPNVKVKVTVEEVDAGTA